MIFEVFIYCLLTLNIYAYQNNNPFKNLLKQSVKLQAPTSRYNPEYSIGYGKFKPSINNKYFVLDKNRIVFKVCGNHKRSEFRFRKEWKTDNKNGVFLHVLCNVYPVNCNREFTFLQIHADPKKSKAPNKPLLRIVWIKKYKNIKNGIWAVIKNKNSYSKIYLGVLHNPLNIKVEIKKNILKIYYQKKLKVLKDVFYWEKYYSYFKLGVYNQCKGCSISEFYEIDTNTIFSQDKAR
ncbi:polysaccharide lyase family 7 protein [Nautilia sp. PV-1]|uniref:polysaccharide lyase family 7 protein n=1 Tax=Nautilia sp. PV-1 TaxID=2579250 RepID=UPI000FDC630D|nr:polysaccharide lyase family 7 protein [Nautilia sp. PV-1]AZV46836.1 polysaccharide lyase family 7 protein [Nautilia sp. PV-1]